ncbi:MAG: bi-domain-containing oxidoreductase [Bacteroidales bacterium]
MKQALVKKGLVYGEEVPAPVVSDGGVLIRVVNSCISAGTELSGVAASGTPLIRRILDQPEKVVKMLNLVRSEGFRKTYREVKGLLEEGKPTGYSLSGMVLATGKGVTRFRPGDRVAAAGGGFASHAEMVEVPQNLVVPVPANLSWADASTVALGSIALHGVRRSGLRLGEHAVVAGSGILGLITIQILKAAGIRVIATDVDNRRLKLARKLGVLHTINPSETDAVKEVRSFTNGYGADAVLFTASTSSSEPLAEAFQMCRRKGRVVLVGVAEMNIERKDMYPGEIDLLISTSYGPGRYDPAYEEKGHDYPYAYVRWTENRNMEEYLRLIAEGKVDVATITEKIYPFEKVTEAFDSLKTDLKKPLLIILDYGEITDTPTSREEEKRMTPLSPTAGKPRRIRVGLIGAGSFATHMHLPHLQQLKKEFEIRAICDTNGPRARAVGEQFKARYITTRYQDLLTDNETDLIMICTRHDSHARLVLEALKAGKNVFVEKPLATTREDLEAIETFYRSAGRKKVPLLTTGFNRRFSPFIREIKKHTDQRINPLHIHYRMNAGYLPPEHWIHEQGGRIIGEACHIIDLAGFLTNSPVTSVFRESVQPATGFYLPSDNKSITLKYADGSVAVIHYIALGNPSFPKEYLEIHFDGNTLVMDDYKRVQGYGIQVPPLNSHKGDKGHMEELKQLYASLTGASEEWPVELDNMLMTTATSFLVS